MERRKFFRLAAVCLVIFFTIGIGSRLFFTPEFVNAGGLVKYKVVSTGSANTVYEYEKLLNDMAFQGWEFDHLVIEREWAVFKK